MSELLEGRGDRLLSTGSSIHPCIQKDCGTWGFIDNETATNIAYYYKNKKKTKTKTKQNKKKNNKNKQKNKQTNIQTTTKTNYFKTGTRPF